MVQAFPLQWPEGVPRTENRERSQFDTPRSKAISNLYNELRLLGAKNPVISSNVQTYTRGDREIPYAKQTVDDPGVAVYFEFEGEQHCFPCDKWDNVTDNIHAIGKTIWALRGIERWGSYEMMRAAFRGFEALPPGTGEEYGVQRETDYFEGCTTKQELKERYRELAKVFHDDKGGDDLSMAEINRQYQEKKEELEESP